MSDSSVLCSQFEPSLKIFPFDCEFMSQHCKSMSSYIVGIYYLYKSRKTVGRNKNEMLNTALIL